jgi:type I restriction enzyme S subunit
MELETKQAAATKVPKGYKQTEVGVIPVEWGISTVGSVCQFINGVAHEKFINASGDYVVVNSKFVSTEGAVRKYCISLINPAKVNDLLMVMSDVPNGRAIAKCYLVDSNNTYTINQRICILRSEEKSPQLLYYLINRNKYYLSFDDGVKQTNLRREDVLNCPIPLPPTLTEQRAIATALSDVDALISSLEQLISKKQAIKQGAMQELLTGKTRLPGFEGSGQFKQTAVGRIPVEWEVNNLNSIIDRKRTIRYGIVQPGKFAPNGKYLIRGQDYSFGWVSADNFFRVSPQIEEPYKNARVKEGDVIITIVGASTGHVEIIPRWLDGSNLTQTTARLAIDPKKGNNLFYKYYLKSKPGQEQVANYIKGAAQPGLNCGDIEKFQIPLPPTLAEQRAIATVLSDMDAEIAQLASKKAKYQAIKQGMMQELLTGKTRLV